MRILYIAHTRFPTEKAHGHQMAHVCHALSELKHSVTLLYPTVWNVISKAHHSYYGLPPSFTAEEVPCFDALKSSLVPGPASVHVAMWSYARALSRYFMGSDAELLYLRAPALLGVAVKSGIPTIIELHSLPRRGKRRFVSLCMKTAKVVCLTSPMREQLIQWGVDSSKIMVEGDAADLSRFEPLPTSAQARKIWKIATKRPVVGYVGSLLAINKLEKGVSDIIQAVHKLKKRGVPVFTFIVGGPEELKMKYEKLAHSLGLTRDDIHFEGHVPHSLVPKAIAACDICVYPAPESNHPFFQRDTSPLKLFEYFAAGRPVVCASLPPIKDIATHKDVKFYTPGKKGALADAIEHLIEHPREAAGYATRARAISKDHTWKKRMQRILSGS